jgi:outer membrane lipoprotein-sorting protein
VRLFYYLKIIKRLIVASIFLILISPALGWSNDKDPREIIYQMKDSYKKIHDYRAVFVRQEILDGKLQDKEKIQLDFKRPFKVKMRWLMGDKKGREVVYVEGENENKMIVKMTGLLSRFIKLVTLDPEGAFAKKGSRHSIRRAGIGNLSESLIRVTRKADEAGDLDIKLLGEKMVNGRKADVIERKLPYEKYESPRAIIYVDQELGIPIEIERYDKDGNLFENYAYYDLEINKDLSDTDFRLKDRYKQPQQKEMIKEAKELIEKSVKNYKAVNDYTATFHKREKIGGKLQKEEIYGMKFLKPFYIYLKKIQGKWKGSEIYYSPYFDEDKIEVRPGGIVGTVMNTIRVPTISLDINHKVVTDDNRHSIKEFGLGNFLEKYLKDFNKGIKRKEVYVDVYPWTSNGAKGKRIELILTNKKKLEDYYAYRTLVLFDEPLGLPVEIKVYDEEGELIENYFYKDLKTNTELTIEDFKPLEEA